MEAAVEAVTAAGPKRKAGRPRKNPLIEDATRKMPDRVPIGGLTDALSVEGKSPDFYYRWVKDTAENGQSVLKHTRAGYNFAQADEGLIIGAHSVYRTDNVGSIIRAPAGKGEFLYLMRQPMKFRKEDLKAKHARVDQTEEAMRETEHDGGYGEIKISRST